MKQAAVSVRFFYYNSVYMMTWIKRTAVGWLLLLILVAATWSLFRQGFFRAHDYVHAARVAEMTTALQEGQFPVRWVKNFGFGYGMPLFEFYAPLPYYIGAALYWLGIDIIVVVKLLFFIPTLLTLIGGYKLGRSLFGRLGGVTTAAALTLAPYRAVNLFVRGAVSEAWGVMALPWILYGIVLVVRRQKHGWLILVGGLVSVMLSHNLTTLMFVPSSLIFAGVFLMLESRFWTASKPFSVLFSRRELRSLLTLAATYALAVGLAAFYLLPAMTEHHYTKISSILSGYFYYSHHFLYIRQFFNPAWGYGGSEWGPNDGISFFLGGGQLLGLSILVLSFLKIFLTWRGHSAVQKIWYGRLIGLSLVSGVLLTSSLYMSLLRAKPIWDAVALLAFIQFPWRWLAVAIMFLALLNGIAVAAIKSKAKRIVVTVVLMLVTLLNSRYFQPETWMEHPEELYYTDPVKIQQQMSSILPDYIPIQVSNEIAPPSQLVSAGEFEMDRFEVLVDRGHEKLVKTWFKTDQTLVFSVADFPGWQAYIDSAPVDHQVDGLGRITIPISADEQLDHVEHLVGLKFNGSQLVQVSDLISLISFGILIWLTVSNSKLHQRGKNI